MKSIKVAEATITQLNYLTAKLQGHAWRCPWMLQKEGFVSWQSYEQAWGNPTPNYCTDPVEACKILDRHVSQLTDENMDTLEAQWSAVCNGEKAYGLTPLIAIVRCYVANYCGPTAEVPDELA